MPSKIHSKTTVGDQSAHTQSLSSTFDVHCVDYLVYISFKILKFELLCLNMLIWNLPGRKHLYIHVHIIIFCVTSLT